MGLLLTLSKLLHGVGTELGNCDAFRDGKVQLVGFI